MAVTALEPGYPSDDRDGAFERTPPQDLAAEQSVLGGVLLSKDAIADVVEVLTPHDFYRPAHALVFEAALDLYSRGEPVDPVSVAAELTRGGSLGKVGGASYLHTLVASVPTAANAGYYARLVAEKAILRRLVEAGTRVVQMGYAGGVDGDVDSAVDRAQAEIYSVSERRSGEDYVALSELLNPTLEEIEAIAGRDGGMSGVPTGITDLDHLTNGLHPGQLVIVAARPGLGKALALDTPLPTPMGWTTMGEVVVGDQLIDADGKPTTVVAATDVMHDRPCYEIELDDGTVIVADAQHQWRTTTLAGGHAVRTTQDLARTLLSDDGTLNHEIDGVATLDVDARHVLDVRRIASVPVRCVQVDNTEHMYLASRAMVPTHNSTLALDFARAASIKHGLASVVFSLEMSKSEITMRLLSAEARVHLQHMRTGHMTDDDWGRLARRMGEVSSAPLFIDDSPHLTMTEIRAKTRRLKQRHDLRLVVVDYMQLMSSPRKVESRQQEVSEISRSMKLLAKELEVPVVALSQLNRLSEQRADKRPMLSDLRESGCLPASTRVWRADTGAEVTIGELFAKDERNIAVWAMDRRMRMVARTMSHVFSTGIKEVFRLRLASGRTLEATANHPLYTYDGWRDLGSIAVGERVAIPRSTPDPLDTVAWPEDRVINTAESIAGSDADANVPADVFGLSRQQVALFLKHLWATDGSLTIDKKGGVRAYYASTSRRLADDVARLLTRFGITARLKTAREPGYRDSFHVHVVGSEQQAVFLREIGCHGARGAVVPRALAIVTGLVANPNADTVPKAVWDRVREVLREQRMPHRELALAMQTQLSGSTMWEHSPSRARLARVAAILDDADLEMLATNDILWDEVVEIVSVGEQEVFDATVPGEHNFVADGVVVHNSLEQDADIVVLLHRDDMYEKESARAGEADLIVAKHRNGPTDVVTVAFQGHYSRFVDMSAGPPPPTAGP